MTKADELKKEANLKYRTGSYPQLHPDWRAFEHGYLAGAEPREKRIAELEKENAELQRQRNNCEEQFQNKVGEVGIELEKRLLAEERCKKLEQENAELKCECRTCVYTDSPCVLSDYPSKNGVCSHHENVFERNAELKNRNAELKGMYAHSAREAGTYKQFFEQLKKENAELKAKNKWYSEQVCNKECAEVWGNLTKAKEVIKSSVVLLTKSRTALDTKTYLMKAEKFIKEIENA